LPDDWFSELDIICSELLIQYKHDIKENENFYEITLTIVKRELNDTNYVPTIVWDYASTPMKNYQSLQSNEIVAIESESPAIVKASEWMKQILEAKYEKAIIEDVVTQCKNLSNTEQQQLFAVPNQFQPLFDGTLGH
jgi:DNA-binding transcriptional regulator YhcF (GntR family)